MSLTYSWHEVPQRRATLASFLHSKSIAISRWSHAHFLLIWQLSHARSTCCESTCCTPDMDIPQMERFVYIWGAKRLSGSPI
ncbi:hypothetical protein K440DRAFT_152210 [Wilcoxina mikolae CBS 423.85]|nr:hypothetical protein K440DRAFT_152210 [Wilcoxina mikolae CBS 423.85]